MRIQGRLFYNKVIIGFIFHNKILYDFNLYLYALTDDSRYLWRVFIHDLAYIVTSDLKGREVFNNNSYHSATELYKDTRPSGIKLKHIDEYILKKKLVKDENLKDLKTFDEYCNDINTIIRDNLNYKASMNKYKKAFEQVSNGTKVQLDFFHTIERISTGDEYYYHLYSRYLSQNSEHLLSVSKKYKQEESYNLALAHFIEFIKRYWRY